MKKLHFITKTALFGAFAIAFAQLSFAVDATYYSSLDGKSGSTLFSAIHTVAKTGYSSLTYAGLWTAYETTDLNSSGKIWDMYGGCDFTYSSDQCGEYKAECSCYNREHSIPKSWFGGSENSNTPGTDLFHIFPTDGYVNNRRSNYAFGEVSSATYTYNGSKLGSAKSITTDNLLGGSVTATCSSVVFEPIDEYKGDFARAYFGTLLRWEGDYQAFTSGDGANIFSGTYTEAGHYGLTEYGMALLMKWHRQDPVSQKEIDRNNGIQSTQGNRNPFIDYPCLAEYLWGNKAGQTFSLASCCGSFDSNFTAGTSNGCSACTETESGGSESGGTNSGGSESGNSGSSGSDSGSSTTPVVSNDPILMVGKPIVVENVKQNDIVCTGTSTLQVHIANLIQSVSVTSSNSGIFTVSPSTISPSEGAAGITVTITKVSNGTATLNISGGVVNQAVTVICE